MNLHIIGKVGSYEAMRSEPCMVPPDYFTQDEPEHEETEQERWRRICALAHRRQEQRKK